MISLTFVFVLMDGVCVDLSVDDIGEVDNLSNSHNKRWFQRRKVEWDIKDECEIREILRESAEESSVNVKIGEYLL